ncbi:MAG: hypothetical protein ACPGWR_17180 [Ardenticatenaceae bacterium]
MPNPFQPARTLREVFNAVDPARPLQSGDSRYVESTAVRGNEDVVTGLYETIIWSEITTTQLFTGHRGCGKSTELLRLKDRLERADIAVVYFQADDVLDLNDVGYTDILIAVAREVHASLPEMGVKPNQKLLDDVLAWFAEVIYKKDDLSEVKGELASEFKLSLPKLISPFAQMMTRVTGQIKTSSELRKQVRQRLAPQITQLIANINLLLSDVEAKLRKKGKQGLVLVIDNLDRIPFRTLSEDGRRNSHDALYIEHGEQLRALSCHLIYSVPIAMFYSPHASVLENIFPDNFIMPMIKTRDRAGQPWAEGEAVMQTILERRIVLDEIFEKAALELLCKASGGHPRDLMTLVRYACRYAQPRYPKPIDVGAAERAIARLVNGYGRMIPEEHFPLLAQVHLAKRVQNDNAHRLMLHNLSVLEYINGSPPWHDVHPAVLRLPKFQEAVANVPANQP